MYEKNIKAKGKENKHRIKKGQRQGPNSHIAVEQQSWPHLSPQMPSQVGPDEDTQPCMSDTACPAGKEETLIIMLCLPKGNMLDL